MAFFQPSLWSCPVAGGEVTQPHGPSSQLPSRCPVSWGFSPPRALDGAIAGTLVVWIRVRMRRRPEGPRCTNATFTASVALTLNGREELLHRIKVRCIKACAERVMNLHLLEAAASLAHSSAILRGKADHVGMRPGLCSQLGGRRSRPSPCSTSPQLCDLCQRLTSLCLHFFLC